MKDEAANDKRSQSSSLNLPPSSLDPIPVSPRPPVPALPLARWRNAILGTLLVIGGLSAAAITLLARQSDNYALAAIAAILSLVSAALMLIFVVPPLARSARLEVSRFDLPIEVTSGGAEFILFLCGVRFPYTSIRKKIILTNFSCAGCPTFVG